MKKRLWALFIVFAMCLTMLPVDALASNTSDETIVTSSDSPENENKGIAGLYYWNDEPINAEEGFDWGAGIFDHFFLICEEGWKFKEIQLSEELDEVARIMGTYSSTDEIYIDTEIRIDINEALEDFKKVHTITYSVIDDNGNMVTETLSVRVNDRRAGMVYRYCASDENGNLLLNENNEYYADEDSTIIRKHLAAAGTVTPVFFSYMDGHRSETPITFSELSTPSIYVTLEELNGAIQIRIDEDAPVGHKTKVEYHYDGRILSFPIEVIDPNEPPIGENVPDPNIGFYTYDENTDEYIQLTDSAWTFAGIGSSIYVKAEESWAFTEFVFDRYSDIATYEILEAGNIVKITFIAPTNPGKISSSYGVQYTLKHNSGAKDNNDGNEIYLRIINSEPTLIRKWGNSSISDCTIFKPENGLGKESYKFYLVEGDKETLIKPEELILSDANAMSVVADANDDENAVFTFSKFGEYTIGYEVDGIVYTMPVIVELPEFGFYKEPEATEENFITEFDYTRECDTFYFISKSGLEIINVDVGQISSENSSIVEIKVAGNFLRTDFNIEYQYIAETDNIFQGYSSDIILNNADGGVLVLRSYDQDSEGNTCPGTYIMRSLNVQGLSASGGFFCLVTQDGEEFIPASELVVMGAPIVEVESSDVPNATRIICNEFGNTEIAYIVNEGTADEIIYGFSVKVELPDFGFYTESYASEDTYVKEFSVTETERTLYFKSIRGWGFTDVSLNDSLAKIADVEKIDSTTYKITITGDPDWREWYSVIYSAFDHESGLERTDDYESISLLDGIPKLALASPFLVNGQLWDYTFNLDTSLGYSDQVWVILVEGKDYKRININDLTIVGDDILEMESVDVEESATEEAISLTATGWGNATIQYTQNGKIYSLPVKSELDTAGFFKLPEMTEDNWVVNEYKVDDENNTLYFMVEDGLLIENYILYGDDDGNIEFTLSPDKTYIIITAKGESDSYYFHFDVEVGAEACICGGNCVENDCANYCYCTHCLPQLSTYGIEVIYDTINSGEDGTATPEEPVASGTYETLNSWWYTSLLVCYAADNSTIEDMETEKGNWNSIGFAWWNSVILELQEDGTYTVEEIIPYDGLNGKGDIELTTGRLVINYHGDARDKDSVAFFDSLKVGDVLQVRGLSGEVPTWEQIATGEDTATFIKLKGETSDDSEEPVAVPENVGVVTFVNGYDWSVEGMVGETYVGVDQIYAFASTDASASISSITGQTAEMFNYYHTVVLEQNENGTYVVKASDFAYNTGAITEGLGNGKIIIMAHDYIESYKESFNWFKVLAVGDVVRMNIEWAELVSVNFASPKTPVYFEIVEETPEAPVVDKTIKYQTNKNSTDVRLVAYVGDLKEYSKVAFTLTIGDKTSKELVCSTAYNALYADGTLFTTEQIYGAGGYFVTYTINRYLEVYAGQEVTITAIYTKTNGETVIDERTVIIGNVSDTL